MIHPIFTPKITTSESVTNSPNSCFAKSKVVQDVANVVVIPMINAIRVPCCIRYGFDAPKF